MSSENLHVPREKLTKETRMLHYAITSLQEELDAVDWYRQRADDTEDAELKEILLHNMREEMEHAAMVLEWIRRNNGDFAEHLKTYLFTTAPIIAVERAAEGKETEAVSAALGSEAPSTGVAPPGRGDGFTIGPMKGGK